MQFLLVLIICLAFLPDDSAKAVDHVSNRLALACLGVLLVGASAEVLARYFASQLLKAPARRQPILRNYNRWRSGHFFATLAFYLLILFAIDWRTIVRVNWDLNQTILLEELLLLTPLLVSLVLGWLSFYRVEWVLHQTGSKEPAEAAAVEVETPFWTRWAYVWFHARQSLGLILAPVLIFSAIYKIMVHGAPDLAEDPWFQIAVLGVLGASILILMPWLLTVIWGAKSLPAGPLRDRLVATARRLGFRYTDILLWNTKGCVANAMITGVLPIPRYVLLSDGLVRSLKPAEIEAVFGHEVGHVKHHHMLLYLGFLFLSLTLITILMPDGEIDLTALVGMGVATFGPWSGYLAAVLFLGCYIWLVFGFLSRRCERQADVFGCKTVSCSRSDCLEHENEPAATGPPTGTLCPTGVRTFIHALEKVADLNGIRRDKPSWRHSSIARRVAFLERLLGNPAAEKRFQVHLAVMKVGFVLALVAVIGLVVWWQATLQ